MSAVSLDEAAANALFSSSIVRNTGLSIGDTIDTLDTQVSDIYGLHELALPSYSDQVLPFDVTVTGAMSMAESAAKTRRRDRERSFEHLG